MNNDELYHYGVLGMRWGRRKSSKSTGQSEDSAEAKKIKKKKIDQMSNDDLQKLNRRQELEQQHKRLNPGKIAKGLLIVGAVAAALGTINKLYKNGKETTKIGKEVVGKYKTAKIKNHHKTMKKALGGAPVVKNTIDSVSRVSLNGNSKSMKKIGKLHVGQILKRR